MLHFKKPMTNFNFGAALFLSKKIKKTSTLGPNHYKRTDAKFIHESHIR